MEVIVQDVKPEVDPILDENSPGEDHKFNHIISNNNSSGSVTRVLTHPNTSKNIHQLQHQSLINNNSSHPTGIQYISTTGTGGIVTPVRTTTILSGQQIQTMAKSSGLSIVHVTLPQVETSKTLRHHKRNI